MISLLAKYAFAILIINGLCNAAKDVPPTTLYKDIFTIDKANFTEKIIQREDAWIVVVHTGDIGEKWRNLAVELRGAVWVGSLNPETDGDILEALTTYLKSDRMPVCVVFPYGKSKAEQVKAVSGVAEAREVALASIPDVTYSLSKAGIKDFYISSYMSKPSRFPVIYLTNEKEIPLFVKAISVRFQRYFQLAIFQNPSGDDFHALGFEKTNFDLPALFTLITSASKVKGEKPSTSAAMYDASSQGSMSYIRLAKFFFTTNSVHRGNLLGDNQVSDADIVAMIEVIAIEKERFAEKLPAPKTEEL